MRAESRSARRVVAGFAWLAAFSLLYTSGESVGLWPQVLPGAFRNWDLVAGAFAVAALAAALLVGRRACP